MFFLGCHLMWGDDQVYVTTVIHVLRMRKKDILMDGMHRVEAVSEDGLTPDEKRSYNRKFTIQNSDIRRANKNSRTSGKRIRTH